jgi:hypothetical protein
VLARLDQIDGVERSYANRTGTLIRVSVAPGADRNRVAGEVLKALGEGNRNVSRLADSELGRALEKEEWRDASRVRELSAIEYRTLVLRGLPWLAGVLAAIGAVTLLRRGLLRTLHAASAYLVIAHGVVHTALTPWVIDGFGGEAVWSAGSGLAFVLLGFLNVVLGRDGGRDRLVGVLVHTANLAGTLFGALVAAAAAEPQAFVGLVTLVALTTTALLRQPRDPARNAPSPVAVTAGGSVGP